MAGCCDKFKGEFRIKNFVFQHENPRTFIQFQCGQQTLYVIWRVFWALYHIGAIIGTGIRSDTWAGPDPKQQVKWFIFLTDWAYLTLTLSTIVDATVVIYVLVKRTDIRKDQCSDLPWYMRAQWCMFTLGNVISVTMSVMYWGLIYSPDCGCLDAVNVLTHIINFVYVLLNLCVCGTSMRLLHFWYSMVYGLVYALFTLFYYLAGGTNHIEKPYVYKVLDWEGETGTTIGYCVAVVFVLLPLVHIVLYGVHLAKVVCCNSNAKSSHMTESEMVHTEKSQSSYTFN